MFGIGAESSVVEMLATMIAQLLEKSPIGVTEEAVQSDPAVAAVIGGTDLQHAIVSGAGARPVDSMGNPWQGSYVTASGNLLADFTSNANAEMQGRVQVSRLYHMTDDHGVRDMLAFLLARDTMHQNQWLAAIEELREEGAEKLPTPSNFPQSKEHTEVSYQYLNFSDGQRASEGAGHPVPRGQRGRVHLPDGPTTSARSSHHASRLAALRHHGAAHTMEKMAGVAQDKMLR